MSVSKSNPVQIDEIVAALRQLGRQATLEQTYEQVTKNRGGVPPEYKTDSVWFYEIVAVIEEHSVGLVAPSLTKPPIAFALVRYGTVEDGEGILDHRTVIALCGDFLATP